MPSDCHCQNETRAPPSSYFNGDQSGNAKEVIDLLGLQALPETQLVLEANGDDASKLMEEIVQFFESGYKKFEELSDLPD